MSYDATYQEDIDVLICNEEGQLERITLVLSETATGKARIWTYDKLDLYMLQSYKLFYIEDRWMLQRTTLPCLEDTSTISCVITEMDLLDPRVRRGSWYPDPLNGFVVLEVYPTRRRLLMAEMIDDVEVKLGRAIRVKNLDPKHGEAEVYIALQVEDLDSKNERCVLFTEYELELCPVLDISWDLVPGRLYPYSDNQYSGYIVKTFTYSAKRDEWYVVVRRITAVRLQHAEERAEKNPEDLTKKSWMVDWLD